MLRSRHPDMQRPTITCFAARLREPRASYPARITTIRSARDFTIPDAARALLLAIALLLMGGWALVLPSLTPTHPLTGTVPRVATLASGFEHATTCVTLRCGFGITPSASGYPLPTSRLVLATAFTSLAWYFVLTLTVALLWLALASVFGTAARKIGRTRGSPRRAALWLPLLFLTVRQRLTTLVANGQRTYTTWCALVPAFGLRGHPGAVLVEVSETLLGQRRRQQIVRSGVCMRASPFVM